MGLLQSIFSSFTPSLSSIFSIFGYALQTSPAIFLFRIFILYLAVFNLVSFFFKAINFAYWRLFENVKYPILLLVIYLHFSNTLDGLGNGILQMIISTIAAVYVNIYLNDFAWTIGEAYLAQKPQRNNGFVQALIGATFVFIGAIYFFLLKSYNISLWFYVYLLVLICLTFKRNNNSIVSSGLVVCITMIQKYITLAGYSNWVPITLQLILFYIALDRQGKQVGVQRYNYGDYPAKSYLFFAAMEIYLYFLFEPQSIFFHDFYLGGIYVLTIFS